MSSGAREVQWWGELNANSCDGHESCSHIAADGGLRLGPDVLHDAVSNRLCMRSTSSSLVIFLLRHSRLVFGQADRERALGNQRKLVAGVVGFTLALLTSGFL